MVILKNMYINSHAVSRLAGTNCIHKPGTIETAQSTFILNALFCKTIKSQQLAYEFDFQFISTFRCIGVMHVNLHKIHAITYCTIFGSCLRGVFELACVVFFSAIEIPYRYGTAVSLDNTYINVKNLSV